MLLSFFAMCPSLFFYSLFPPSLTHLGHLPIENEDGGVESLISLLDAALPLQQNLCVGRERERKDGLRK